MSDRRRLLAFGALAVALGLITWATLTPSGDLLEPRPTRWCLTCSPIWLADAISNVVLFVPLGATLVWQGVRASRAMLLAALFSLAIELLQAWLPYGRTPALADWLSNSAGAALGALVASSSARLLRPGRREAQTLALIWAAMTAIVMAASWWALSPATPSAGASSAVAISSLPFTPGHGWYAALADSATVNGVPIRHGGNGPIIAEMRRTDTVRAMVRVRGRDDREAVVPIVYVHSPRDKVAHLLLGQRGNDAVLGTWLNAARVGLKSPMLALNSVFAPNARTVDAPLWLTAVVKGRALQLSARYSGQIERHERLVLTPLVGWTLLQQIVRVDSPLASLMTALWALFWVGPLVFWSMRARKTSTDR